MRMAPAKLSRKALHCLTDDQQLVENRRLCTFIGQEGALVEAQAELNNLVCCLTDIQESGRVAVLGHCE